MEAKGGVVRRCVCALALVLVLGCGRSSPALAQTSAPASAPADSLPRLSAASEHLVLGTQEQTTVLLELPPGSSEPRISASVGQVTDLQRLGGQRYQARYLAPDEFYPQPAIIAAVARQGARTIHSWTVLPLWGQGEAAIQARPGSQVAVQVAGKSFGPVQAGAEGIARIALVVPPGVSNAWRGKQKVALNLPPAKRLHLIVWPDHVPGHAPQQATAFLFAVNAAGEPTSEIVPRLTMLGDQLPLQAVADGTWQAGVPVPAGKPATLPLTAQLGQDPAQASQVTIARTPGPPSQLVIRAPAKAGATPETVRIRVTDALGTPVDGKLQASVDQGRLGPLVRVEEGLYEVLWRPPLLPAGPRASFAITLDAASARQTTVTLSHYQSPRRWWASSTTFWVAVGGTSALLTAGLVTRGVALQQSSEYKDSGTSLDRRRELKDSGEVLTLTSNITLGLAAAAAAMTVVLYFLGQKERGEQQGDDLAQPSLKPLQGLSWSF